MSSSDTAAFTDPVFLAQFGLSRITVLDYFLHPLNPFKSKNETSNEVLLRKNISIGMLMERGTDARPGPMTLPQAEEEYRTTLSHEKGEQYELLPPPPPPPRQKGQQQQQPAVEEEPFRLFTIRHVRRSSQTDTTNLGIYYVLNGVIYKTPSVRVLMKAIVSRTINGLEDACDALSGCAWYEPSTGYTWNFEDGGSKRNMEEEEDEADILNQMKMVRQKRRRRILDNRRPGERTEEEEEGIRAKEKINGILVRLSKKSKTNAKA